MQFIKDGPELPNSLLRAFEKGNLVFFCGAGISLPAGLPNFEKLTKNVFLKLKRHKSSEEQKAIDDERYDLALGLLESDKNVGRENVRKEIAKELLIEVPERKLLETHISILDLSKDLSGHTKLVTTNFDRLFQHALKVLGRRLQSYFAPQLPIPRNQWNGVVHLHGLLEQKSSKKNMDSLVVTSGDFGKAYLLDRWAARFASELFRNFNVCFIGYSVDDPILRYMVDAAAMDKNERNFDLKTFSLCSYGSEGDSTAVDSSSSSANAKSLTKEECISSWQAKNVIPIPYDVSNHHEALHDTLSAWAKTYRTGTLGKNYIINLNANRPPSMSTEHDDYVGRVLWAMSDYSGRPAKTFAEMRPTPTLDWLEVFSESTFNKDDLETFDVFPDRKTNSRLTFSLINRPAPSSLSLNMSIFESVKGYGEWDEIMIQIGNWLLNHLHDQRLLFWMIKRGDNLHPRIKWRIQQHIMKCLQETKVPTKESKTQSATSSMRISLPMVALWNLYICGRVGREKQLDDDPFFVDMLRTHGLTSTTRVKFVNLLTPKIELSPQTDNYYRSTQSNRSNTTHYEDVNQIARGKIILSCSDPQEIISVLEKTHGNQWEALLREFLPTFTSLLMDALNLLKEVGQANENCDYSFSYKPSISKHEQNKYAQPWSILIDLVRDAWLAEAEASTERARMIAQSWTQIKFPIFKRLAFFAATHDKVVAPALAVSWLQLDSGKWILSPQVRREVVRLVASISNSFDTKAISSLANTVVKNISYDKQTKLHNNTYAQAFHLLKALRGEDIRFSDRLESKYFELSEMFKNVELSQDESDDFPILRGGANWGTRNSENENEMITLEDPEKLAQYMEDVEQPSSNALRAWQSRCKRDLNASFSMLLRVMSKRNSSSLDYWRIALSTWPESMHDSNFQQKVSKELYSLPDKQFKSLVLDISCWVENVITLLKKLDVSMKYQDMQYRLIERILKHGRQFESSDFEDDPIITTLNHPVGIAMKAALQLCFSVKLSNDQGLPGNFKILFRYIDECDDPEVYPIIAILASNVVSLFSVDKSWTQNNVLSHFGWASDTKKAAYAWAGFLYSTGYNLTVMSIIKDDFLDTAMHFQSLGRCAEKYPETLTRIALMYDSAFTKDELSNATRLLSTSGFEIATRTILELFLSTSSKERQIYLKETIMPYLNEIWPGYNSSSPKHKSSVISSNFGSLCNKSGDSFTTVLKLIHLWLTRIDLPKNIIGDLHKYKHCKKFPIQALCFLYRIVDPNFYLTSSATFYYSRELEKCLDEINDTYPNLESHDCYRYYTELRALIPDKLNN